MRNLEVLSLLTQVNRKLDCGDTTSFPETKKRKGGGGGDTIQPCLQKPGKTQVKSESKKQGDVADE